MLWGVTNVDDGEEGESTLFDMTVKLCGSARINSGNYSLSFIYRGKAIRETYIWSWSISP